MYTFTNEKSKQNQILQFITHWLQMGISEVCMNFKKH